MRERGDARERAWTEPAAALPCVWMSAGLVSFKLCDRGGECEGCPFDRAMLGPPRRAASAPRAPSRGAGRRPARPRRMILTGASPEAPHQVP